MKLINKLYRAFLIFFYRSRPFVEILEEYFKLESRDKSGKTIQNYECYKENILNFLNESNKGIVLHEIRPRHMENMRKWLFETKPRCGKNYASRHINHCISTIEYAKYQGYINRNRIEDVLTQHDEIPEPVSCTAKEVIKFTKTNYVRRTWPLVVDLFLFQCFTGISYMDLWLFTIEEERVKDKNGNWRSLRFIKGTDGRGKNSKPYSAFFNSHAEAILKKYNGKFPKISNSTYNVTLKKICIDLCITKDLSTHNGRKTYVTLRLNQGMTLEALEEETGATAETLKRHYATPSFIRSKRETIRLLDEPFLEA